MGKFKQYVGKTEIEVNGEKLELDADLNDMQSIMSAGKDQNISKLGQAFVAIMQKSYPNEPIDEVKGFVSKNILQFMEEVSIAWNFTTRDAIEREKEAQKKKSIESLQDKSLD